MRSIQSMRSRVVVCATSAGLSILIHALFIGALIGAGRSAQPRHDSGLSANEVLSADEATGTLFFFEDPAVAMNLDLPVPGMASYGKVLQALRLTVVSPEINLASESESVEQSDTAEHASDDSSSDREGMAALYGRYLGQIQARIERAWIRPRSETSNEQFDCHIQVQQNARGEVAEVTLQTCGEDIPWQLSLIRAVERASPLPAPPDPKVFAQAFELAFHAVSLAPGTSEFGYEPASAQNATRQ